MTEDEAEAVLVALGVGPLSEKAKTVLHAAGWTPERAIDISHVKDALVVHGYHCHAAAEAFLTRFGDLATPYTEFDFISRDIDFVYESDECVLYAEQVYGKTLCPVGYFGQDDAGLLLAEDGTVYWIIDGDSGFLAETYTEALNKIFEQGSEMYRPKSQQVPRWVPQRVLSPPPKRLPLLWEKGEGGAGGEVAYSLTGVYRIVESRKGWFLREYSILHGSRSSTVRSLGVSYKQSTAAKAACERHHATGEWE